jgi:hypothetical protein
MPAKLIEDLRMLRKIATRGTVPAIYARLMLASRAGKGVNLNRHEVSLIVRHDMAITHALDAAILKEMDREAP